MQLEQTLEMYQPRQALETERQRVYTIRDLESLSASALYTPKISGSRFVFGNSRPLVGSEPLTIRSFSGFELHIHDRAGGTAHIKYPDVTKTHLNSYDAAMADLLADKFDIVKYLRKDKSERKGRV